MNKSEKEKPAESVCQERRMTSTESGKLEWTAPRVYTLEVATETLAGSGPPAPDFG